MANELISLIDRINAAIKSERILRVAVSTVLAEHKPRIFEKGLDGNGSKIGTYGTDPISISKKNQAKQTGKTYFKGGYAEYKKAIGKNNGFVNLDNTSQMKQDYGIVKSGTGLGLGFQNQINYEKSQWMQDKYDKNIFDHTDQELNLLADVLVAELNKSI